MLFYFFFKSPNTQNSSPVAPRRNSTDTISKTLLLSHTYHAKSPLVTYPWTSAYPKGTYVYISHVLKALGFIPEIIQEDCQRNIKIHTTFSTACNSTLD